MAPATHAAHAVASVEILTGLFFSATMTGFIFARLARPRESWRSAASRSSAGTRESVR